MVFDAGQGFDEGRNTLPRIHEALKAVPHGERQASGFKVDDGDAAHARSSVRTKLIKPQKAKTPGGSNI